MGLPTVDNNLHRCAFSRRRNRLLNVIEDGRQGRASAPLGNGVESHKNPVSSRPSGPPVGGFGRRPGMPDLTSGPIGPTLVAFALPVLGTNILQSLNGTANAIWVSHALGAAALTATTNANTIFFLMLGSVFGITMAANLLIGQAIGAGDRYLAKRVVGTAVVFFTVVSILVGLVAIPSRRISLPPCRPRRTPRPTRSSICGSFLWPFRSCTSSPSSRWVRGGRRLKDALLFFPLRRGARGLP